MSQDRSARFAAYQQVRELAEQFRGLKLHDQEADTIIWAAEGMLLAASAEDQEAQECATAFATLTADLSASRWKHNATTMTKLTELFAACGPQPTPAATA